jgi:hypothetical protein
MRANVAALCLSLFASVAVCSAQNAEPAGTATQPDYSFINCSGFVSDQKVSNEIRVISGEQSNYKVTFARGDNVYINRGQDKGVRVGDRFSVVRPEIADYLGADGLPLLGDVYNRVHQKEADPNNVEWFKSQHKLLRAMGTTYSDLGQIRIVNVSPKVSIGEITLSCGYMQRGDLLRPLEERPSPPFKDPAAFDHFAPISGKPVATLVVGTGFIETFGRHDTGYVNIGNAKGVKVGDYLRVFRYQGRMAQIVPQTEGDQYELYGFGTAGAKYAPKDLPREVIGEGIVLNVSRNSATILITYSTIEIYAGDYVEVE